MADQNMTRIKTISEFHRNRGLPPPMHPLISVVDFSDVEQEDTNEKSWVFDFYQISLKRGMDFQMKYGHQQYDFDEGVMLFIAPNQVLRILPEPNATEKKSGYILLVHPDLLWNTPLAKGIKQYDFFNYTVNEALFLSDKEEKIITGIVDNIRNEYHTNIDKFSERIIISHIESLLNYADRFYERQFITRKIGNHKIINQLDELLNRYFENDLSNTGLPSVQFVADSLSVSPNYLSHLLKSLSGQSTQQLIHDKLIEKAKEKLTITDLSVSEIAYQLGFEHPQSFTKLFKKKTNQSPSEFRQLFH